VTIVPSDGLVLIVRTNDADLVTTSEQLAATALLILLFPAVVVVPDASSLTLARAAVAAPSLAESVCACSKSSPAVGAAVVGAAVVGAAVVGGGHAATADTD